MHFLRKISDVVTAYNTRRLHQQLFRMNDDQLIHWGYSPVLINHGVSAWPWRLATDTDGVTKNSVIDTSSEINANTERPEIASSASEHKTPALTRDRAA